MDDPVTLGMIALFAGGAAAVVLLVPFIAVSYRRRGRLTFWRSVGWLAILIYFFAIWSYTLLPLPETLDYRCLPAQLEPLKTLDDVRHYGVAGAREILHNRAVQQVVLNVILFMPLGFLIRSMFRGGVVVSFFVGAALSFLIESTQYTGVWGLFPCAYRLFDVDDMITNTAGAVIGSIVALVLFLGRGTDSVNPKAPQPVTVPRRFLGMFVDVFVVFLIGSALQVGWRGVQLYLLDIPATQLDTGLDVFLGAVVPGVIQLLVLLISGATIGEHTVLLAPRYGSVPVFPARLLRFVAGIGGYMFLSAATFPLSGLLLFALILITFICVLATPDRRGFAGLVSGTMLVDERTLEGGSATPTVR